MEWGRFIAPPSGWIKLRSTGNMNSPVLRFRLTCLVWLLIAPGPEQNRKAARLACQCEIPSEFYLVLTFAKLLMRKANLTDNKGPMLLSMARPVLRRCWFMIGHPFKSLFTFPETWPLTMMYFWHQVNIFFYYFWAILIKPINESFMLSIDWVI